MIPDDPARAAVVRSTPDFVGWPDDVARHYREIGWWAGRTLGEELRGWATRAPDHTAVVSGDDRWTYRELDLRADVVAARLEEAGIRHGDAVVLQLPNSAAFVAILFGLFRLGARPVIALAAHRRSEVEHFCRTTDATAYLCADVVDGFDHRVLADEMLETVPSLRTALVVGDPGHHRRLSTAPPAPGERIGVVERARPGDLALLLLSGGTTGQPKLVPRTHDDWSYSGRAMAEAIPYESTTVTLVSLAIGHNWPLTHGMLATFHAGGTLVLAETPDPVDCFELVERERVTDTGLVPGTALLWMDEAPWTRADLSSLRRVAIGGSKLDPELARQVEPVLGARLQQMFGMAEGLIGFVRDDDPEEMRIRSQGRPVSPGDEIRVVDADDHDVPEAEVGEMLARGPYTIRSYYRAPEHDRRSFTRDGYYRTGDLVRLLPGGFVEFAGRIKDQINRGGEKISAQEVESHVMAHPRIRQAAVVGVPDTVLGERCCVCVVPSGRAPGVNELRAFLTERGLAAYKMPDACEILDSLPVTALGKIDKAALSVAVGGRGDDE